jgi:hypothetical protein
VADNLGIGLIALIVRHDVERKAGIRNAIVDNSLLNITLNPFAGIGGCQRSRRNACQHQSSDPG